MILSAKIIILSSLFLDCLMTFYGYIIVKIAVAYNQVYLELSQLSVANHYNSVLIEVADLYK